MPDPSNIIATVAVTAQVLCALLLAVTFAYVARLFNWSYLRHWTLAWRSLLLALLAVRLFIAATAWPAAVLLGGRGLWAVYLVAEWVFIVQVAAGCGELASGQARRLRRFAPALAAGAAVAVVLVPFFPDFNRLFVFQSAVLAVGYAISLRLLSRVPRPRRTAGFHLMRAAAAFLGLLFAAYVPVYLLHGGEQRFHWLGYSSLADLSGQLLLGFGMLFVVSEEARRELSCAVAQLAEARDALERQARTDALTGALNRFAFDAVLAREGMPANGARGVVAMIDLDHLKEINDSSGHGAGDAALQAAARAIRTLLGEHDLLFRWGGDEFLLLLHQASVEEAARRLAPLGDGVEAAAAGAGRLHLSWGFAEFGGGVAVRQAVADADRLMYELRAARRAAPSQPVSGRAGSTPLYPTGVDRRGVGE